MIETVAGIALFGWSYAVAMTSLYGAASAAWQRRQLQDYPRDRSMLSSCRVLVIRPCAGMEPELARTLRSLVFARTSASLACRFAVERASDPAAPEAESAARMLRDRGIDATVVLTRASAPNHKSAQIAEAIAREQLPFDALVIADSDIDLEGFDLDTLLAPLFESPPENKRVGAVWAPPIELEHSRAKGDRASCAVLDGSLHAFTILGGLDGSGLVGKLFAARRDAIEQAGGFGALTRVLGEDMELAKRLTQAGYAITAAASVATSRKRDRTWQSTVDRYVRWLTVIRAQRPHLFASYPLLFFATLPILAASLVLAPFSPVIALATSTVALAGRLTVAIAARALAGQGFSIKRSILSAALADVLLAQAFARALSTPAVKWRGRLLVVRRGGDLCEAP